MKVAVIVPNWNGEHLLCSCLDALAEQADPPIDVIVVDNGSSDGSVDLVRRQYPHVRLVELEHNQGFAGGVNRGIEVAAAAGAEWVALLNNDAAVDASWLFSLVAAAECRPEVGIVASKVMQRDDRGRIDTTGACYSRWGFAFPRGRDEIDHGQYDDAGGRRVFAGSGAADLYRVAMFRQIGLFDESFFAYFEDVDLCFRAHLAGWSVRYEPTAVAFHRRGATSSRLSTNGRAGAGGVEGANDFVRFHTTKNFVYLYVKNMPGRLFWKYLGHFVLGSIAMMANSIRRRQWRAWAKAMGEVACNVVRLLRERRRVQALRVVPVADTDAALYPRLPPRQRQAIRTAGRTASWVSELITP